jgi:hypothetical protein
MMRGVAVTLIGLIGLAGHALAVPKKSTTMCTAKVARARVLSFLGPTNGGWKVDVSRKMGTVKQNGVTKRTTTHYLWRAVSNKKSYAAWDGTEGTPGYLYKVFEGMVDRAGKVSRLPTFGEWTQSGDSF